MTPPRGRTLRIIGVVRTPHREAAGTPIQPVFDPEGRGEVRVRRPYERALEDLDGFDCVWLLTWLDRARPWRSRIVPFRDVRLRGLFSTRSPSRPNPIGLTLVRLVARRGRTLEVAGVDLLDRTPLLDIKPYVPRFDSRPGARGGWLDRPGAERRRADGRFAAGPRPKRAPR